MSVPKDHMFEYEGIPLIVKVYGYKADADKPGVMHGNWLATFKEPVIIDVELAETASEIKVDAGSVSLDTWSDRYGSWWTVDRGDVYSKDPADKHRDITLTEYGPIAEARAQRNAQDQEADENPRGSAPNSG